MEGDEVYDASSLGHAESIEQERISDDELIIIKGTKVKLQKGLPNFEH
jgi:T-complex protein 1 subunit alpha